MTYKEAEQIFQKAYINRGGPFREWDNETRFRVWLRHMWEENHWAEVGTEEHLPPETITMSAAGLTDYAELCADHDNENSLSTYE